MVRATLSSEQSQHRKCVTETAQKNLTSWILLLKIHIFTITDKWWCASHRNVLAFANLPTVAPNPPPILSFSFIWKTRLHQISLTPRLFLQFPSSFSEQEAASSCGHLWLTSEAQLGHCASSQAFRVRCFSEANSQISDWLPTGERNLRGSDSSIWSVKWRRINFGKTCSPWRHFSELFVISKEGGR